MLDQTFSATNFRRIYDVENRKGNNLERMFTPNLDDFTRRLKNLNEQLRLLRSTRRSTRTQQEQAAIDALLAQRKELKAHKDKAINDELETVAAEVRAKHFRLALNKHTSPKGHAVYTIDNAPNGFFVVKHLQRNLHRLYGVKQSDRHQLVRRVRDTLSNKFPYEVVRTDIKSFYESIDRSKLSKDLDDDQLLSLASKRFIRQLLQDYGSISGNDSGIPRGVGISAYLAELFMRKIDHDIQRLPGILLYCRYVDDIIAVFSTPPHGPPNSYLADVERIVTRSGLLLNPQKTRHMAVPNARFKFEYLGYRFDLKQGALSLSPSSKKVRKYRERLKLCFRTYYRTVRASRKMAARRLISRLRFLTGNTRLANNKRHALTGIYYNNAAATNLRAFFELDRLLQRLASKTSNQYVIRGAAECSFVAGFEERRFHSFTTQQLQSIVKAWKHAS